MDFLCNLSISNDINKKIFGYLAAMSCTFSIFEDRNHKLFGFLNKVPAVWTYLRTEIWNFLNFLQFEHIWRQLQIRKFSIFLCIFRLPAFLEISEDRKILDFWIQFLVIWVYLRTEIRKILNLIKVNLGVCAASTIWGMGF